jgi:hypothetical protein
MTAACIAAGTGTAANARSSSNAVTAIGIKPKRPLNRGRFALQTIVNHCSPHERSDMRVQPTRISPFGRAYARPVGSCGLRSLPAYRPWCSANLTRQMHPLT